MEIKIIECKNIEIFERTINDFFFLLSWHDFEVFYFKKESKRNKHIAIIVFKEMRFGDYTEKIIRKQNKEVELKNNPELKTRLETLFKYFCPKKEAIVEKKSDNNRERESNEKK